MELTPNLKNLHTYLIELTENVHEDAVLAILLAKLSQASTLNRVKVRALEDEAFTNIYVINFIPSGAGKDKTLSLIDSHIFKDYYKAKALKVESYKKMVKTNLEGQAEELGLTDKQTKAFVFDGMPRDLVDVIPTGTVEGFFALRAAYEAAGFGGTLAQISEFSDYILQIKAEEKTYLTAIKEVYETGDSSAKIIKGEKRANPIKGIPNVVLFQSTATGLLEYPGSEKMKAFLNKGLARRSIICFPNPDDVEIKDLTFREYKEQKRKLKTKKEEMQNIVSKMVNINPKNNVFVFDEESEEYLYNIKKKTESIKYAGKIESTVADARALTRKTLRLAGLIALIEHPSDLRVYIEDVKSAESILSYFGKYLDKFINTLYEDDIQKLASYLIDNKSKWLKKMDFRSQNFTSPNNFKRWFDDAIEEVKTVLVAKGYELVEQDIGSIGKQYILKKIK